MNESEFRKNDAMEEKHWWFKGRRAVINSILKRLEQPEFARILDVGCGTGGNIPLLSRYGTVDAMEYNALALKLARSKHPDTCIRKGKLPDEIPYENENYDLVCAFDVLEHIQDDQSAVMNMVKKVRPGGYLFCTAPANQWLWSSHDIVNQHYRRYSLDNFVDLFMSAGLQISRRNYYNTLLFPIAASARLLGLHKDEVNSDLKQDPTFIAAILEQLFSAERFLIPHWPMPFGISVLCVARKCLQ
ncbi:methyltransferase domain-containing protein [Pseudodesulfovibrio sp.]|uniref:methyltransferase domain-containing protein n=1 Tax=unclassified Pseudodesulfovibrio TaxID=2661612 RepID=UPI003AFFD8B6